ncbi:ankyrin [Aspergillus ellipticus CBS 707.79]|uniref:Ankyrin n=1 Tax=Aspergillus ellipticus CBS 707.79 TaxID=1448320 RepID=A0A319CZK6_9EURO|nr:ankyrin [Aspergillus ellipticus CBS 707.79]
MSLDCLPNELILEVGLFLQPVPLAALIQSAKRYARLLSPRLLSPRLHTLWVQRTCGARGRCHATQLWKDEKQWSSPFAIEYFQTRISDVSQFYRCSTLLHRFAEAGILTLLNIIVSRGADVNSKDKFHESSPLHLAALRGHIDIARALIDAGADMNAYNDLDATPLQSAVAGKCQDMVAYLIDSGADIFAGEMRAFAQTILLRLPKVTLLFIQALKNAGLDIETPAPEGSTMLRVAASLGCAITVQLLLNNHANPFVMGLQDRTVLHTVCKSSRMRNHGNPTQTRLLVLDKILQMTKSFKTTVDLSVRDVSGYTALHYLCESTLDGNEIQEFIRSFITAGADVDMSETLRGETPIYTILHASDQYEDLGPNTVYD